MEHIIVDGVFTYETVAIAKRHAPPDAIILSERDSSLHEAINKGVATAVSDIIGRYMQTMSIHIMGSIYSAESV